MIDYKVTDNGVAVLTWNLPDRPVNVMNDDSLTLFTQLIEKALADKSVKGMVIASAKRDFITGADLATFFSDRRATALFEKTRWSQIILRRLETGGKPVCAAINGTALGGGLEIALACHHRVVADIPTLRLGLPEVTLGLLPGAGGTQRLPRLIGIAAALPLILEGKPLSAKDAAALKIIDEVVPAARLIEAAVEWVSAQSGTVQQPWDRKGFQMPGGAMTAIGEYGLFAVGTAQLTARTFNTQPAPRHILSSVYEGCATDIDSGLKCEARHFVACALSAESQSLIRTSFFGIADAAKLKRRPKNIAPATLTRIGVLGAGMMGRGIAHVAANAGLEVVLIDSTTDLAAKGRDMIAQSFAKKIGKGGLTEAKVGEIIDRILPADDFTKLAGCQLVVEAVFEDRAVKADVTKRAEAVLSSEAIVGSNTSTLPITGLAEASARPENFIGIHFFSPVDRMRLVEIIRGKKTSDECLAHTMDFIKRLGKVPIIVNDARGFYTTRVFQSYLNEGLAMVGEGIDPALIENAARQAGMPIGPLALCDEVSFELLSRLIAQTRKDVGASYKPHAADDVVAVFHDKLKRVGRKAGGGFYEYAEGAKRLWSGISTHFPRALSQPSVETLKQRLLYIQGIETVRCMEEGVLEDPQDADVGAVLGWGFPAYLGGPFSMIDTVGVAEFVRRCTRLAEAYGERFAPPALLLTMTQREENFYAA